MYEFLHLKYSSVLAGFFGGVVYIMMVENKLTKLQMLSSLLVGIVCAGYLTPLVAAFIVYTWRTPPSVEVHGGIAFLIGLSAVSTIPLLLARIQTFVGGKKPSTGE